MRHSLDRQMSHHEPVRITERVSITRNPVSVVTTALSPRYSPKYNPWHLRPLPFHPVRYDPRHQHIRAQLHQTPEHIEHRHQVKQGYGYVEEVFVGWLRGRDADEDAAKWVGDEKACY